MQRSLRERLERAEAELRSFAEEVEQRNSLLSALDARLGGIVTQGEAATVRRQNRMGGGGGGGGAPLRGYGDDEEFFREGSLDLRGEAMRGGDR